jgi:iron complex outermembrane recepter protein
MMPKTLALHRSLLSLTAVAAAISFPSIVHAQDEQAAQDVAVEDEGDSGDIIVTATRRESPLSDVPVAVSAISGETLQNAGVTDIRELNQVSPSLFVSSTSSEAGGGGARIRGIGTVGDNPGLESSVATFIDGVYRSRAGVGLTELGPLERIEVLRGPQGTLFGRNASAGLINVVTADPKYDLGGYAEATYGNYDAIRVGAGVTGGLSETVAARVDGIYFKRDGFIRDRISGRDLNNRDRWMVRGKLLFEPSDNMSLKIGADYSKRNEECCAASQLPFTTSVGTGPGTAVINQGNPIANLVNALGGQINSDTFSRETSVTPGRGYRSDVKDWGVSSEFNWEFGDAELTSITAYRVNRYDRGQDADFNALDILVRPQNGGAFQRFRTMSQELRLQGSAFDDKLDWLVGGYYANEQLTLRDNLIYGATFPAYSQALVRANPALATFPGFNLLNPFVDGFLAANAVPAAARAAIVPLVPNLNLANAGLTDRWSQNSENWALFTHNIINFSDSLSLTLGLRYTNETKTLDASLRGNSQCGAHLAAIANIRALGTANPALAGATGAAAGLLTGLQGLPCVINPVSGNFSGGRLKEDKLTGTVVLSYKPTEDLLTYASFSRGYKAGGFNLDRAGLNIAAPNLNQLTFAPEAVDAFELGAKFNGRAFDVNVAAFYQLFDNFQLNTFNGVNFVVENITACGNDLNGLNTDAVAGNSACTGKAKSGVTSKGVEIEARLKPADNLDIDLGFVMADTKYKRNLAGTNGTSLITALFQLPGRRLSNSSLYTLTGGVTWTPPISDTLEGLLRVDFRYQSDFNTGSDLDFEKIQEGVGIINGRVGVSDSDKKWSIEGFVANVLNTKFYQVAFDTPLQGGGTFRGTQAFGTTGNQIYSAFLAEPRTYGITVRTRF